MIISQPDYTCFQKIQTPLQISDPTGYIVPSEYLTSNISREHPIWHRLVEDMASKKQDRIIVPGLEDDLISPSICPDGLAYPSTSVKSLYVKNKGKNDARYSAPSAGVITENELTRSYIKACLEDAGEIKNPPGRSSPLPPLYYVGGRHSGEYAYIDLVSAYWSIQKTATIDMLFCPEKYCVPGKAKFLAVDEITDYREMRRSIPGSFSSAPMRTFKGGSEKMIDFRSEYSFSGITNYTKYVMHAIAKDVIKGYGALMVLTDAYIVPADVADDLVEDLREVYGVEAEIEGKGEGAVYFQGCYNIPGKKSSHSPDEFTTAPSWIYKTSSGRDRVVEGFGNPFNNLLEIDTGWMQSVKSRFVI